MAKKLKNYAVSYARGEKDLVYDLNNRLEINFKLSKKYKYDQWIDEMLPPTNEKPFTDEIISKFEKSDFILLFGSPLYFTREFIQDYEIPMMMREENRKLAILIMLKPLDFDNHNYWGFENYNWFHLNGKAYSQCESENEKDEFASKLFIAIEKVLRCRE